MPGKRGRVRVKPWGSNVAGICLSPDVPKLLAAAMRVLGCLLQRDATQTTLAQQF